MQIFWMIWPLILIAIIGGGIWYGVYRIRRAFRRTIGQLISESANTADVPRSISNLESVYLPTIRRKYPDLQPDDLRHKSGIVMHEYLRSVRQKSPTPALSGLAAKSLCDSVKLVSGDKYIDRPYIFHQAAIRSFDTNRIGFDVAFKTDIQRRGTVTFAYTVFSSEKKDSEPERNCDNCGAVLNAEAQSIGACLYCEQVFRSQPSHDWLAVKVTVE